MSDRHILVGVAWPYANGLSHLGHIAGAYLPADIFARYHRTSGHRVLMVSGSDSHGTPITVEAERSGVDPADVVGRYHPRFLEQWERLGIQWELFTSTMTENHYAVTQDMFARLVDNGYFEKRTSQQYFDPEVERYLPDRYVRGTCPHCGYGDARGDQCDNCGRALDPTDLIDPRSALSGAAPVLRDTEHWYLLLSKLQDQVRDWLAPKQGWRAHVKNYALGLIDGDGLHDRAMTRDLDWGVPLPPGYELAAGKRIYVWFDAVIGYLSAAKEWAQLQGDPDAWKAWWQDPDAESYYFVGKDNIWFHAVFWPAMLIGYGGLDLPTDVPANQYVTFKGEKASKSRGIGRPVLDWLDEVQADSLRYAVAANLPEQNDTDLDRENMERRINDELVATWGNLVNRVFTMVSRNHAGTVPDAGELDEVDGAVIAAVDGALDDDGGRHRTGRAQGRPADRHERGAGRERLPQRPRAVEDGRHGPRAHRHDVARRARPHRRGERGALAVPALLRPGDQRVAGPRRARCWTTAGSGAPSSPAPRSAPPGRCSPRSTSSATTRREPGRPPARDGTVVRPALPPR